MSSEFLGSDCVGRIIDGRFTLLRWLGGTAESSVFLTELESDRGKRAALKFSPANAVDAEARVAQWTAARGLSHPALMRLFHAGRCTVDGVDLLYVVTEYAEEVLSEILRERPLTSGETSDMLVPVVDALSWLHERDLLHGHLQPSNIMVVDGRLKLSTDTLHAAGEPVRVSAGIYDAPEVALGKMSAASDVWSLGMVLVEALTQQPPAGERPRNGNPVVPASIPPPFFGLARACLQADPGRRWTLSGIGSFLEAPAPKPAARIKATQPPKTQPPRSGPPRSQAPGPLVWRSRAMIGGAVLLVAVIVAALAIVSHHRPSARAAIETPATQPQSPGQGAQPNPGSVVQGAVAYRAIPDVPEHIRDTIEGHIKVLIAVEVDSSGNVADAAIDSPGPSRYFANRALEAARKWKFTPARTGSSPVASKWMLQFHFGQDGTTVTPTETSP
ncbi:MAG: TonB family protein [Acidobacteriaceae bacterium]